MSNEVQDIRVKRSTCCSLVFALVWRSCAADQVVLSDPKRRHRIFIGVMVYCVDATLPSCIDWGFPVSCLPLVRELQFCGVQLIWFDGDIERAREEFVKRGGIAVTNFDTQVAAIQNAGYPASLNCGCPGPVRQRCFLKPA